MVLDFIFDLYNLHGDIDSIQVHDETVFLIRDLDVIFGKHRFNYT
jgi:hypothetical protein